ncbi:MAG: hypothetical protein IPJ62_09215 [Betaproteobacteria bacterium]|nr:hypothetical protein [Betaproteobacteria bacterium]
MSTLRVRLDAPPTVGSPQPWALYDAAGALLRTGCDPPSRWPAAAVAEAVVAAAQVRVATLRLPPLPTGRLHAAASFAIEDQLAGPADAQHVAVSRQAPDGSVRAVIVERTLLEAILALPAAVPGLQPWSRVVAEPDLAPAGDEWRWYADDTAADRAFMRFPDGSAMALAAPPAADELPDELLRLLAQTQPAPEAIAVHATVPPARLAQWTARTGVRFAATAPWRWNETPSASFAAATDLRQGDFAPASTLRPTGGRRLWRTPMLLVALAFGLHLAGTVGEWAWLQFAARRDAAAWRALATGAGIADSEAADATGARAALERRFAEARHANGLAAPGDALPLLARAAPVLARLPPGSLKSATFAASAWTVELGAVDPDVLREFDAGMKAAGLPALIARTNAGTRARFGKTGA